jgi:pimeloyl-ACP methyl ester carboxylesterase
MTPPSQHYTQLDHLRLHHLAWEGMGTPVLFIPGFIANAYGALQLAKAITPQHPLYALDLRGRGGSDKPQGAYHLDIHLEDLSAWIAAHSFDQIILAGHSYGAAISLFLALRHPDLVAKIILLDGGVPPSEMAFQLFLAYHRNLTYDYPSAEAYLAPYRTMVTMQPWTDEAEQLVRANLQIHADGTASRTVPRHVVEAELDRLDLERWQTLTTLYKTIQAPVLLIRAGWGSFGKEDQHITDSNLALMQNSFADFRVYEMPEAGHTSILTVPDSGRDAAIHQFLADS